VNNSSTTPEELLQTVDIHDICSPDTPPVIYSPLISHTLVCEPSSFPSVYSLPKASVSAWRNRIFWIQNFQSQTRFCTIQLETTNFHHQNPQTITTKHPIEAALDLSTKGLSIYAAQGPPSPPVSAKPQAHRVVSVHSSSSSISKKVCLKRRFSNIDTRISKISQFKSVSETHQSHCLKIKHSIPNNFNSFKPRTIHKAFIYNI